VGNPVTAVVGLGERDADGLGTDPWWVDQIAEPATTTVSAPAARARTARRRVTVRRTAATPGRCVVAMEASRNAANRLSNGSGSSIRHLPLVLVKQPV